MVSSARFLQSSPLQISVEELPCLLPPLERRPLVGVHPFSASCGQGWGGMEGEIADGDTVCSFCGMSHLMYGEMRKKERRIVELEKELAKATASGGRPATAQEQTKC